MPSENLIVANWKMNKTPRETREFFSNVRKDIETVVCVPFTDLQTAVELTKGTEIRIGAQNCYFEDFGAFTGEISAKMLQELGTEYVILGHSERRQYFGETNEIINKKIKAALEVGLKVVLCVGESAEQRESGVQHKVVIDQVKSALDGVDSVGNVIIAYEPVWAIGTGKTCDPHEANLMCGKIRMFIDENFSEYSADNLYILYGGSMNAENAATFLKERNINGGLIGGASLDPEEFNSLLAVVNT